MENNEFRKPSQTRRIFVAITAFFILFLIYYSIMSVLGSGRKINELREGFRMQQEKENAIDEIIQKDSAYMTLVKEKAFLQSKITMAETDSVYMTLNIQDSTANLEISGVQVHSVKMSKIKISHILRSGDRNLMASMLAAPMSIVKDYATIKKEPIMIKMAPRDTSEFKPDIIPDTSDYEPVNYILEMNNGLCLYFYQNTDTIGKDKQRLFFFDLNYRLKNSWSSIKSIARLKIPEYHPFIKIRLPKADAKILYRAVPRNGQIAVYL